MSLDAHQVAEAFSSYRFAVTYPYTAHSIKWTIVGREGLAGRQAVIDRCEESANCLETVSAIITEQESQPCRELHRCRRRCTVSRSGEPSLKRCQLRFLSFLGWETC